MSIQIRNGFSKGTLIQVSLLNKTDTTCVIDGGETYSISANPKLPDCKRVFPTIRLTEVSAAEEINKNRWDRNEMMGMLDAAHRRIDQLENQLQDKDGVSNPNLQYEMPL